jgi:hypothetical protein
MTRSTWVFILLVVVVALVAWAAYTRTHPGTLPNFHW